jgi:hypothetical protein
MICWDLLAPTTQHPEHSIDKSGAKIMFIIILVIPGLKHNLKT